MCVFVGFLTNASSMCLVSTIGPSVTPRAILFFVDILARLRCLNVKGAESEGLRVASANQGTP